MKRIPDTLSSLSRSKFRTSFKLNKKDRDGKRTPFKGHPVFKAQHATATCCRKCLKKWYNIPKERRLSADEFGFIVDVIMGWIKRGYG